MKAASSALYEKVRNDYILSARPKLIAEWNLNRYTVPVVTNTPAEEIEGYDRDLFPIESLVDVRRPRQGVVKARLGSLKLSSKSALPAPVRYVMSSEGDSYKYWTSPVPSATSPTSGAYAIAKVDVRVDYQRAIRVNKLLVNFEEHGTIPTNAIVYVQLVSGGTWVDITAGGRAPASDGTLELYYNSGWSTTDAGVLGSDVEIYGVRVVVNRVDKPNRHVDVIEIAPVLRKDLSPYFISSSTTMDSGKTDDLLPVGSASSNIADITLFNALVDSEDPSKGLLFSNENEESPLFGMVDANAKFTLGYTYDLGAGVTEYVQEFVMYADDAWGGGPDATLTVGLVDSAKELQLITVPQVFYKNKTAVEIAWRILDAIGFDAYSVNIASSAGTPVIPYFYTDGTEKVWEVFQSLSEATQVAFWFDAYGVLQIKSRDALFSNGTSQWTIRGDSAVGLPSDLKTLTPELAHRANVVNVKYKLPYVAKNGYGTQLRKEAWSPSGDTLLGSSDLTKAFPASISLPASLYVSGTDVASWEYNGYVSVQGEIMRYEGKMYGAVLAGSSTKTYHWIKSQDEYDNIINRRNTAQLSNSGWTGGLRIVERGAFNTETKNHNLFSLSSWRFVRSRNNGFASTATLDTVKKFKDKRYRLDGTAYARAGGYMELTANKNYDVGTTKNLLLATRGAPADIPPRNYGTKFRLAKDGSGGTPRLGMHFFGSGTRDSGYYVEVRASGYATKNAKEIIIRRKTSAGDYVTVGSSTGYSAPIVLGSYYTMDVQCYRTGGGADVITVWINGRLRAKVTVPAGQVVPYGGRWGLFARAATKVRYEYAYALTNDGTSGFFSADDEDRTFLDFVSGGYISDPLWKNYFYQNVTNNTFKKRPNQKKIVSKRIDFFDEFGPVVHEMQHFEVELSNSPIMSPTYVSTNAAGISIVNFKANHRSAEFYAVNTSRDNALMHGSVAVTGGTSNQKMLILGYLVEFKDEETITVKNEQAIRTFGVSELDITSEWLQSNGTAQAMADWISQHWADASSTYTASILGNPLITVGDIVDIDYELAGFDAGQNRFIVMEVVNDWDTGLSTTLKLRQLA